MSVRIRADKWCYVEAPGSIYPSQIRDAVIAWCDQNVLSIPENRIQGESWLLGHNGVWFADPDHAEEFKVWFTCTWG
jgi:hypothetical protein